MVRDVKPGGSFLINCQWTPEELEHHLNAAAKRYIAENNIHVYLINAIDLAIKVGMGKRTNTILQSAFFALAKVLPAEEAIQYMKDAAEHSYAKKGQAIVEANWKAIDAGATAFTEIEIPESWKTATDEPSVLTLEGKEAIVKQVKELLNPIDMMDGDSLPVSAFKDIADGQFELGASAYEKRGVASFVPRWDESKCIQCNNCANVCPHAAIRPFALDEAEAAAAPEVTKMLDLTPAKKFPGMKFTLAISPLDCMGCGVCVGVCPKDALSMVGQEEELAQQAAFDYAVANVTEKEGVVANNLKGIQFKKPLLEFSGSCAGCAETAYARLVTQVAGDRMFISNATGCSSIWGNPAATSPYTTNAEGHGPAWNNSLFEDNAEHGLGMALGYKAVQGKVVEQVKAWAATDEAKAAAEAWIASLKDPVESRKTADALIALLEADGSDAAKAILADKAYMAKKSFWIFGGDGWAYDIGFGGLDHVLASGQDVNVFVFDTEVYSNTGGQASKASNIGQVAQFAAAGKEVKKKSLAEIAMSYGYVYVAQVAMGANPAQTLKAIQEAEATAPARCTPSRAA